MTAKAYELECGCSTARFEVLPCRRVHMNDGSTWWSPAHTGEPRMGVRFFCLHGEVSPKVIKAAALGTAGHSA